MTRRSILALALALITAATPPLLPAHADCTDDCERQLTCDGPMRASGECNRQFDQCLQLNCNRQQDSYGAIAYGPKSTSYGYAYDKGTQGDANRLALSGCQQRGNDCKLVISFRNSCAAVAAGAKDYTIGQGDTREDAQSRAMLACNKNAGGKCEIMVWTCSQP